MYQFPFVEIVACNCYTNFILTFAFNEKLTKLLYHACSNRGAPGISGNAFDCWVQKSMHDDSAIIKMQYQFWVRKQALSQKLGKKEDECIVASDAELDAKLELFRSIQDSCSYLQRVIDKYQERLCSAF